MTMTTDHKSELYWQHVRTIAMTVNESNRFQPVVYWTPGDEPLEYGVEDTATMNEDGDPTQVALTFTFMQAVETAYRWTLNPRQAGNDWSDLWV